MPSDPPTRRCPRCQSLLSVGEDLGGHCGACLLEMAMTSRGRENDSSFVSEPWIQLPGFELYEELGSGGSGVVYRGRQLSLDRPIAVKILRTSLAGPLEARHRFQREALASARLQHPAIVRVFDTGVHAGLFWLSMEYVDGRNLDERCRMHDYSPEEAGGLVLALAEAMEHAHNAGVLHRDLKPSNVLVDRTGLARITDFGLATLLQQSPLLTRDLDLTRAGQTLGSPGYAAPELSLDGEASPATDVYGLGAILYFILSGEPPVQGKTIAAILARQRESDPLPLRHFNRRVPRDLELICAKCLRREPRERYATAQGLADDLRRFLAGETIRARPPSAVAWLGRRMRQRPGLSLLAFISCLLCLSLVSSWITWNQRQQQQERRARLLNETAALRRHRLAGQQPLAFAQLKEAESIRAGADLREERLAWLSLPEIGPRTQHGRDAAQTAGEDSYQENGWEDLHRADDPRVVELRHPRSSEHPVRLVHPLPVTSISRSGDLIATGCENRFIYIWDTEGRLLHRLSGHQGTHLQVLFRPHRQELVSVAADHYLRLWHAALGTEIVHLEVDHPPYRRLAWADEGTTLRAVKEEGEDHYAIAWPRFVDVLAPGTPEPHSENLGSAAVDTSGQLAAVTDENQIRLWDFNRGAVIAHVPKMPGQWLTARFARTAPELWLCGWDLPLTRHRLHAEPAGWTVGQGERLRDDYGALLRDSDAQDQQWLLSQNGTGTFLVFSPTRGSTVVLDHPGTLATALDPEGRWVATSSYQQPGVRLWTLPTGQRVTTLLPEATARQMLVLPDHRLLVDSSVGPRLLDTQTWLPRTEATLPETLASMTLSHDARWLATLGTEEIRLWNTATFAEEMRLPLPSYVGWLGDAHLVFSAGGPWLLLHTGEGTVVRWDLQSLLNEVGQPLSGLK